MPASDPGHTRIVTRLKMRGRLHKLALVAIVRGFAAIANAILKNGVQRQPHLCGLTRLQYGLRRAAVVGTALPPGAFPHHRGRAGLNLVQAGRSASRIQASRAGGTRPTL